MRQRRLCTSPLHRGPRYLSHVYFYVKVWGDIERTWPAQLQSHCMTCQRIALRTTQARRRGKSEPFRQQTRMTREERRRRKRRSEKEYRKNPEYCEKKRRYAREWARAKRVKEGVRYRGPWKKYREEMETNERVTTESFMPILVELFAFGASRFNTQKELQIWLGINENEMKALVLASKNRMRTLSFDLCDKVLTATGNVHLSYDLEIVSE